jgi:hypothetical protein
MGAEARLDVAIAHRLERYPFPVAHPARALEVARDPADRLERAGYFVEMGAVTLGVMAMGWCGTRAVSPQAAAKWQQALDRKGVALGSWIELLRGVDAALVDHPTDPVARPMHLAVENMVPILKDFVPVRNRYVHGGPRVRGDVDGAARDLTERASSVLDRIEPLTSLRLGIVTSCGKQPQAVQYEIDLDVLTGYAELWPTQQLPSRRPFDKGTALAFSPGNLEHAIDLTPYAVWRRCDQCGRDELFYLTKRQRTRSDHYSFSTSHQLRLRQRVAVPTPDPVAAMSMVPIGSRRAAAAHGWRASWADLAPRHRRLAARAVDAAVMVVAALVGWLLGLVVGLPVLFAVVLAGVLTIAYEPVSALVGGGIGKRLLRIEAISVWDCRPLGRGDRVRRALVLTSSCFRCWPSITSPGCSGTRPASACMTGRPGRSWWPAACGRLRSDNRSASAGSGSSGTPRSLALLGR